MRYSSSLHNYKHVIKAVLGRTEKLLTGLRHPASELLVLNYHGTQRKFLDAFREQVNYFKTHYRVIRPDELDAYFSGTLASEKPMLLFTFDDGILNNLQAAEILEQHDIRAFFFIVPAFIDTRASGQKAFFLKNIRPAIHAAIDSETEDFSAIPWEELIALQQRGHALGSHTMTHTLLRQNQLTEESHYEVVRSGDYIEEKTGRAITSFCSPNDTLTSMGIPELKLANGRYAFHFATYPGSNQVRQPHFIRRINVEAWWLPGAVMRATGNWDRGRWAPRVAQLENLIREAGR